MKKGLIVGSIVIFAVGLAFAGFYYVKWKNSGNNSLPDPYIELFVNNYPTDILILGEEFDLHDGLYVRYSKDLNPEVLKTREGCVRQVVVLFNYESTVDYSLEDLSLLRKKIDSLQCDFFCVGKSMDAKLVEAGILLKPQAEDTFIPSVYVAWGGKNYSNGLHSSSQPDIERIKRFILEDMQVDLRDSIS